jgi:UPF0271 protein
MNARASIDLNADVGEGSGSDAALVPLVSSVNIACGAHAGDEAEMEEAIRLAQRHGAAIGAHPSFEDRENFGRKEILLSPEEAAALVIAQTRILQHVAARQGARVGHIKLHGALYNMAARDPALAAAVSAAVARHRDQSGGPGVLFALAGSALVAAGKRLGLHMVGEAFADRTYRPDGSLTPRSEPGSVIADPEEASSQALCLATGVAVRVVGGSPVVIAAESICLHGDSPAAVAAASKLRQRLDFAGIKVRAAYEVRL